MSPTSICGKEGHVAGAAAKIEHAHARDDHPAPTAARHQVVVSWRNEQRNHPEGCTSLRTTARVAGDEVDAVDLPPPRERGHLKCQPPRAKEGDMRESRVTEEQLVSMLKEAEAGQKVETVSLLSTISRMSAGRSGATSMTEA